MPEEVVQSDSNTVLASIRVSGNEKGFSFYGGTSLQVQIDPAWTITPTDIFIGSDGVNPPAHTFTVSADDVSSAGLLPHAAGIDSGVYIGYDPLSDQWTFLVSNAAVVRLNFVITASSSVTGLEPINFVNADNALADRLFLQHENGFDHVSAAAGVDLPLPCGSVTAADFDNDMDVDLYLVCTTPATNRPNILYENLGDGRFQSVLNAGGAA
ncbi:MAG: hypothetical protein KJO91_02700, partial [Gammaproteobacteria bacterium]|nr:hypothetical protein [Gammaproteobacteria bacterium]